MFRFVSASGNVDSKFNAAQHEASFSRKKLGSPHFADFKVGFNLRNRGFREVWLLFRFTALFLCFAAVART